MLTFISGLFELNIGLDGTLARGDDHSNYTHKQEYVKELFEHDKS